jgi:hypothetical protein
MPIREDGEANTVEDTHRVLPVVVSGEERIQRKLETQSHAVASFLRMNPCAEDHFLRKSAIRKS